jgi:hypothetical protein
MSKKLLEISNKTASVERAVYQDFPQVIHQLRQMISGVPDKVQIPNYEKKLNAIEQALKDGLRIHTDMGPDSNAVLRNVGTKLQDLIHELDPNVMEHRKAQREKNGQYQQLLMGVKHG